MKLISHRGNIEGKENTNENHPHYIKRAMDHGYDVEIDVWFDNGWYLGQNTKLILIFYLTQDYGFIVKI